MTSMAFVSQSEQSVDDFQGHKITLMRWGTLVQCVLGGRDSVFVVRECWEETSQRAGAFSKLEVALAPIRARSEIRKNGTFIRRLWMSLSLLVILCLWCGIGKSSTGWIASHLDQLGDSVFIKYLVAMHWSSSQLRGSVDIYPGTQANNLVLVVLPVLASIFVFVLLVSIMTGALFTLRDEREAWHQLMDERQAWKKRMVDNFLDRHQIKGAPRKSARHHLQLQQNVDYPINEYQDRQVLEMFPPQLRCQLLAESRTYILEWHPVFLHLKDCHAFSFARVCTDAIFGHVSEPEDHIFMSVTRSLGAYFIARGEFVFSAILDVTRLCNGQLVTEISLWTPWVHAGDMTALSHGECFCIRWSELLTILQEFSEPHEMCCSYAGLFVNSIQQLHSRGVPRQKVELLGFADVMDLDMFKR